MSTGEEEKEGEAGTRQLFRNQVVLIRHGRTEMIEKNWKCPPIQDDPLSFQGREGARNLSTDYLPSQEPFDVVFVSPLARALETGLLIFQHQPPPKMIVNFDLVEFNEHQTYNDTKYFRHIGHSRQYLREKLLQSYLNGDPFSGGLNGESERLVQLFDKLEWMDDRGNSEKDWIPVSDFQSDAKSVSCISRLTRFLKMLWEKYLIPDLRVCIVAHENVFRLLAGLWAIGNTKPTPMTTIVPLSNSLCCGPCSSIPFSPCPPLFSDSFRRFFCESREIVVLLGCSDSNIFEQRVQRAVEHLIQSPSSVLLFTGSRTEYTPFRKFLLAELRKDAFSNVEERTVVDVHSKTTYCNAFRTFYLLYALSSLPPSLPSPSPSPSPSPTLSTENTAKIFVTTSDWHIPRAMLIFQQTAKRFPNSPPFEFKHLPTPTLLSHLSLYSDNHLMDSLYLVHLITKEGPSEHLFDSLFENWREEMIVLRQTAIMKRGRSAAVAAPISKRFDGVDSKVIIQDLVQVFRMGLPSLRSESDGGTVVHWAAQNGNTLILKVAYVLGEDFFATNKEGKTLKDVARRHSQSSVTEFLAEFL